MMIFGVCFVLYIIIYPQTKFSESFQKIKCIQLLDTSNINRINASMCNILDEDLSQFTNTFI